MVTVTGRKNEPMDFVLSIPKKITRRYHGTLEIKPTAGVLIAVVTTDREAAVASVVAAESMPDTPAEALKAQAIATRSYFVAGGKRHHDFDFCDTTHCQFLREPTPAAGAAARVVAATRGFVLAYDSQLFSAITPEGAVGPRGRLPNLAFPLPRILIARSSASIAFPTRLAGLVESQFMTASRYETPTSRRGSTGTSSRMKCRPKH
jgi:hypothetical protein